MTTEIKLTEEQEEAVKYLLGFPTQVQRLGGLAGCGKSTLVSFLLSKLPGFAVCAYTGKAANVLRRKGVSKANTIHSTIYVTERVVEKDDNGNIVDVEFVRRQRTREEMSGILKVQGFIVDEASMVPRDIHDHLCSYKLPIIYIGDHGQLEPIGDGKFNIMSTPDVTLETIHRNAGEIAWFAGYLREGGNPRLWYKHKKYTGKAVRVITPAEMNNDDYTKYDQIICAFNATRVAINQVVRDDLEYPEDRPIIGDRVMCLQNDKKIGVFNGMQGIVRAVNYYDETLQFHADGKTFNVRYDPEAFNKEKRNQMTDEGIVPFDYSYCVTCHKMQGDEADHVLVLEQKCKAWDHRRWAYTAASRAKQSLTWVVM